nr:hypothetical protein [Gemmatimonadales bacterium]
MKLDRRAATATEPLFTGKWDGRVYEQPSVLRLLLGGEAYCVLRAGAYWLKHELGGHPPMPFGRRLEVWRRGFFAESAVLYDLPRNDPRDYVSDFQYHRMFGRVNEWDGLYNHKMALRAFLLARGFRQAPTLAYLLEGRIFAEPFTERARYVSPDDCLALLQVEGDAVDRPHRTDVVTEHDARPDRIVLDQVLDLDQSRHEAVMKQQAIAAGRP